MITTQKFVVEYETPQGVQEFLIVYAFDVIDAKHVFIYGHPGCIVHKVKPII